MEGDEERRGEEVRNGEEERRGKASGREGGKGGGECDQGRCVPWQAAAVALACTAPGRALIRK